MFTVVHIVTEIGHGGDHNSMGGVYSHRMVYFRAVNKMFYLCENIFELTTITTSTKSRERIPQVFFLKEICKIKGFTSNQYRETKQKATLGYGYI